MRSATATKHDVYYDFSESDAPPTKKVKTSSVVVEQAGQSDRLLIDQVTDVDSIFDEVSGNQAVR